MPVSIRQLFWGIEMSSILFFIVMFLFWLLLTLNVTVWNIAVGVVASLIVTIFLHKYSLKVTKKVFQIQRYFWALLYGFIFLWECLKANMDVAYRVLHPGLPIKPGIVKAKSNLTTDIAKVFLANSITMTPGTITVDIIDDNFFIHWIYIHSKDPEVYTHKILGRFEKFLKRIFE
jgi:multicomponent Na+:H+ antiporter subunit E